MYECLQYITDLKKVIFGAVLAGAELFKQVLLTDSYRLGVTFYSYSFFIHQMNDEDDHASQVALARTNLYSIQPRLSIDAVRSMMGLWLMRHFDDIEVALDFFIWATPQGKIEQRNCQIVSVHFSLFLCQRFLVFAFFERWRQSC